mgnify:CR=1 FL=1
MKYTMKSNYISFNKMKNNECHVEVRLFDKKRQQLKLSLIHISEPTRRS